VPFPQGKVETYEGIGGCVTLKILGCTAGISPEEIAGLRLFGLEDHSVFGVGYPDGE